MGSESTLRPSSHSGGSQDTLYSMTGDSHPSRSKKEAANSGSVSGGSEHGEEHEGFHIPPPVVIPTVADEEHPSQQVVPTDTDERDEERAEEQDKAGTGHESASEPDVFDRFSPRRKTFILATVSYAAFISPVTSSIFLPSIPQMSEDLGTSASVINYTVAIFLVTIGAAPLVWSPLSGFYGRKPIYLASMPLHILGSIGVAQSKNVGALIGTRILQGIGGSAVLAVGAGSVGDLYRPTERANAMGWYYAGALIGPSLAPLIAGLFTQYTALGWRSAQYFLAGCGALAFALCLTLPETSHPPLPHHTLREARGKKFVFYWFNPLTSVGLLRWPNITLMAFTSSCVMLETYAILVPLGTFFKSQYHLDNVAKAGAVYLANGGANIIGGRIAGPYCDRIVKKYIAKRGFRRPEDRLHAATFASIFMMPLACIAYGWLLQYKAGGIGPPIVMLMINGVALLLILTPVNTYLVDCMQKRSAETIAVNNFVRYVFSAAASAFVLPMVDKIGLGGTMTFAAGVSWLGTIAIFLVLRYGHIWRERADAKYAPETIHEEHLEPRDKSIDEKAPSSTEEGDCPVAKEGRQDEENSIEQPAPLVQRTATRKSTRSDMPPVQQVLSRTMSISKVTA